MINTYKNSREKIIGFINEISHDHLAELEIFIDYLRYKSTQSQQIQKTNSSFLMSIAGLGSSGKTDISERDEEILQQEVSPRRGWTLNPNELP